jgi:hypothetical protein
VTFLKGFAQMLPKPIQDILSLRQSYRRVFSGKDGERVLTDLMRKYIIGSPVAKTEQDTLINIGMQRLAQTILEKACGNEEEFRRRITESYENKTNQDE